MTHTEVSRRDFIKKLAITGGAMIMVGKVQFLFANEPNNGTLKAIMVNFDKCTGCRTCETVCSAFHYPVNIDGQWYKGLGNPKLGNIQVHHFNPDVDIPIVCNNCPDTPCVNACPVTPDPLTGYKAIYRDQTTHTISTNHAICISCGSCYRACEDERTGIIRMNPVTDQPERICDHCEGDPECVKNCPYGALTYHTIDVSHEYYGLSPDKIAGKLYERYYTEQEVINE